MATAANFYEQWKDDKWNGELVDKFIKAIRKETKDVKSYLFKWNMYYNALKTLKTDCRKTKQNPNLDNVQVLPDGLRSVLLKDPKVMDASIDELLKESEKVQELIEYNDKLQTLIFRYIVEKEFGF